MSDLARRLIVGPIFVIAAAMLLYFAFAPIFQYFVWAIVAALAAVAVWEYGQFVKVKGGRMITPALICLTICQVISFALSACGYVIGITPAIFFFLAFLVLFALQFKEKGSAIVDLAVSSFGLMYVAVPMGMLLAILYYPPIDGRWWIAYLLSVTKITDVGAYFAGSLWGRRKLAPAISPKKTIEGALFGLVCAMAVSFAFYYGNKTNPLFSLNFAEALFLGFLLGVVGQFGDLSESLLKRDANKKDSNSLPGLGGILDALDSILFNAAILYMYLYFIRI